jgi:condensin complex subunit 1
VHDTNGYARAGVLRVWTNLVELKAMPHTRVATVAELASDRLKDKSSLVRKAALHLLCAVVAHNPMTMYMDPSVYKEKAQQVQMWLEQHGKWLCLAFVDNACCDSYVKSKR